MELRTNSDEYKQYRDRWSEARAAAFSRIDPSLSTDRDRLEDWELKTRLVYYEMFPEHSLREFAR